MNPFLNQKVSDEIPNYCYLIAEIGGNHQGSFEKAEEICNLAIKSGAN